VYVCFLGYVLVSEVKTEPAFFVCPVTQKHQQVAPVFAYGALFAGAVCERGALY
jgi:hypothetical protein